MDLDEEGRIVLGFWGLEEGSGTINGEKKKIKNKGRRWCRGTQVLKTRFRHGFFCPPQFCQHTKIKSLKLKLLQELKSMRLKMLVS